MHFRHISAKLQPQNLKQHFDWGAGHLGPLTTPLVFNTCKSTCGVHFRRKVTSHKKSLRQGSTFSAT